MGKSTLLEQELKLVFRSTDGEKVLGWVQYFSDAGPWSIGQGNILSEQADALVSPANSQGRMDGGIDLLYKNYFPTIESKVQSAITNQYHGFLPVGRALIIPTNNQKIPHLIVAPTMETPQNISQTNNVYLAFQAVLERTLLYNQYQKQNQQKTFNRILIPAMGTGVGKMDPFDSAAQMKQAFDDVKTDLEKNQNQLTYLQEKYLSLVEKIIKA